MDLAEHTVFAPRSGRVTPSRLARLTAIAALLWLLPQSASAFAPDAPTRLENPATTPVLRATPAGEIESVTLMERISRRLRRIPLRPMLIGETQRTPYDPKPGAGVAIRLEY